MVETQVNLAEIGFGEHLILDGYGCPSDKLADPEFICETLNKFSEKTNFTKIMPPYVYRCPGTSEADQGVSGVLLVEKAHITIHTFPQKQHVFIDVFAEAAFDAARAAGYLIQLFEAKSHAVELLNRQNNYADQVEHDFVSSRLRVN